MKINKPLFMADNLRIATKEVKDGSLIVPLKPNWTQLYYLAHKAARNVVLKARQLGTSTIIMADFFIDTISIKGIASKVVSHAEKATQRLLDKLDLFYSGCPDPNLFPKLHHDSDTLKSFKSLNSTFDIATARSKIISRGETVHRCLLSEFPFYDLAQPGRSKEIFADVGQSVPLKGGILTVESSPFIKGDEFYKLYMGAKEKTNNFKPFFFTWWLGEDYVLPLDKFSTELSLPEEDLIEKLELYDSHDLYGSEKDFITTSRIIAKEFYGIEHLNLTPDHIRWRRYKIREIGQKFWREYPEDDTSCWINPEAMIFNKDSIYRLLANKLPVLEYRPDDGVKIWEMPDGAAAYVIGVDMAEGIPHGNFSAASVQKVTANNVVEVAAVREKLPIDRIVGIVAKLGKEYGDALIAIENNAHGISALDQIQKTGYPNIYWSMDDKGNPTRAGWTTWSHGGRTGSRQKLIDDFDLALKIGVFQTSNEDLLNECLSFIDVDGKPQAPKGDTDDSLFAAMIGYQIKDFASPMGGAYVPADRYGMY